MSTNPIFDAAIDALHKRPEAVLSAIDDFVKPTDHIEAVAKRIYTEQMGLCELIEYLRAEFGMPQMIYLPTEHDKNALAAQSYQVMQENIQAVR